ncbi:BA14K family protein [uncultured Cohaesibacter sp.]|uniref:BA14K family protein n=1 Tax=uncultured Cohaesibacter sp. TaxID=1002546 RepID=UPI002930C075|nr:BA14K family protein [uncultured Cohaesibacter sp.]
MNIKRTMIVVAIALGLGVTGLPMSGFGVASGLYGVSKASAQPRPRYYPRRPPKPRSNSNVGVGLAAGAIIGLAAGAIAASAAQKRAYPQAPNWCNVRACSQRYRSFRAYDCTFQPYNGPRRYCRY